MSDAALFVATRHCQLLSADKIWCCLLTHNYPTDEGGSMRKNRWGLILAGLLLMSMTAQLSAADGTKTELQPQDEPRLFRQ
jgi:hypothetical protein